MATGRILIYPQNRRSANVNDLPLARTATQVPCKYPTSTHHVTPQVTPEVAAHKPLSAVFRDAGFVSDRAKINAEQVFTLLSPGDARYKWRQ